MVRTFVSTTGIDKSPAAVPSETRLLQNYPNPFNPTTTITYQLPVESRVTLKMYDLLGQVVAVLADGIQPFVSPAFDGHPSQLLTGFEAWVSVDPATAHL
jgi:hypothetical protein